MHQVPSKKLEEVNIRSYVFRTANTLKLHISSYTWQSAASDSPTVRADGQEDTQQQFQAQATFVESATAPTAIQSGAATPLAAGQILFASFPKTSS